MMFRYACAASILVATFGCGAPATTAAKQDDGLRPGTATLVVVRDVEINNEAFSKGENGKVTVVLPGRDGFGDIPDGTRAIVLEDANPTSEDQRRPIKIRIDEGEYNGKTCKIARLFLVKVGAKD